MKTHLTLFTLLATMLMLSPAHAKHVGGPPYEAGILCLDGANRGSATRMEVRKHVDQDADGHMIHAFPLLSYYARKECKRLIDIGVDVGQVVDIYYTTASSTFTPRRCTQRYSVTNTGDNKHLFVQVGGYTMYDGNCRFKTDWELPNHARPLLIAGEAVPYEPQAANKDNNREYDISIDKKPILAGTFCVDGANLGSDLIGEVRALHGKKKGSLLHASPRLGYYKPTRCYDLSKKGIPKGTKMVAWWSFAAFGSSKHGVCRGRNVIENDGSDKTVWIQLRGRTLFDAYCETKRALNQAPLE
ncbi:MAG: hypothetical protein ACR2P7_06255 [bacterium]